MAGEATARTILHVDLDAFFAAVEQRDQPELRGLPVVVGLGGKNDRGVVAAASYEARRFGVHSAMPIRTARRLCPDCRFVPARGAAYQAASREVMAILRRFTPLVEPISIDEAFLDVTASRRLFGDGPAIARRIKDAVRSEQGLTVSVGVAASKLVAKVASDLRKPDGLVVVPPGGEAAFLAPLAIGRLWGVGPQTAAALDEYGVATIGDLAALDPAILRRRFGKHGLSLADRSRGIDPDPVEDPESAKSVGHEHTFDEDTADREVIDRTLLAMTEGVSGRLRAAGLRGATITLKLRDSTFHTITRQATLPEPTDLTEPIFRTVLDLARKELHGQRIRLVGVSMSHFGAGSQLGLFADEDRRQRAVVAAADEVRKRFGPRAITRARLIRTGLPAPFERDLGTSVERRGEHAAAGGSPDERRPQRGGPVRTDATPAEDADGIDEVPADPEA